MGFKIGDKVIIKAKVFGLVKNDVGIIKNIDGFYIDVLPYGRKEGQVVELYPNEIEKISVQDTISLCL